MQPVALLAVIAFLACLGLTPLVRLWSHRLGAVDLPDGSRKLHSTPIPRTGGVAIALACATAFVVFLMSSYATAAVVNMPLLAGVIGAVMVVFITGLIDDLVGLHPYWKLGGQVIAACCAYASGVEVLGFAGFSMHGWWSLPVTVIWLVLCANAVNLIDGVDGLAAGIGLVAASTTLFSALLTGNLPLALATAPLVGALFAFLHYNFNPASIFLGDCGSLTIGFVLGCFGAIWSQKATTLMGMTAPLMALSIPLLDTSLAIVRRYLRNQPIFHGDRNHIHHRLLQNGFSPRDVAFALCGVGALAAAFAIIQTSTHSRYGGVVVVVFAAMAWFGVRSLGYVEFQTARYLATSGIFRHILHVQVYCREMEAKLTSASTADDYWRIVREASRSFGFVSVRLRLAGAEYEAIGASDKSGAGGSDALCRIRVPLRDDDYVEFAHLLDSSARHAVVVGVLTDILQREMVIHDRRTAWAQPAGVLDRTASVAEASLVDTQ